MAEYWNGTDWVGGVAQWNGSTYERRELEIVPEPPDGLYLPFNLPGILGGGSFRGLGGSDG